MKGALQLAPAPPQEPQRDLDPALSDRDLMALVRLKKSEFWRRKKLGVYRALELPPEHAHARTRYSRTLVARYLAGLVERMPLARIAPGPVNRVSVHDGQRRRLGRPRLVRLADGGC